MFFADYVAWAYDTGAPTEGAIARMKRADFYDSTKWDAAHIEIVAQLNPKSAYFTYPIAADTWLLSMQSTSISAPTDGFPNSQEIIVVSGNGGTVSGGIEQVTGVAVPGVAKNDVITFPAYPRGSTDAGGLTWLNLNAGSEPRAYTAVPVNYGIRPHTRSIGQAVISTLMLPNNTEIRGKDTGGLGRSVLVYDNNNRTRLQNSFSAAAPEVRVYETASGLIGMVFGGGLCMSWTPGGSFANSLPLYLGTSTSSSALYTGTGNPEGTVAAQRGSLYLNLSGGHGVSVWQKQDGSGNTGWVPLVAGNPITAKTGTYTMLRTDSLIVMTSAAAASVHLIDPTTAGDAGPGRVITVKNAGAGTVTVDSLGTSKTIDGAASISLTQWQTARLVCDGTQWLTI
jgi:hypothetical protein